MGWSVKDKKESLKQGWGLFKADGKLQLQRWDMAGRFEDDAEAWMFVYSQSQVKDRLAVKALAKLVLENPDEIIRIKEYLLKESIQLSI